MKPKYQISDLQCSEEFTNFRELKEASVEFIELTVDSYGEFKLSRSQKAALRKAKNINDLQKVIDEILNDIATAQGYQPWAGHGNFYCSPADEAGYYIVVEEI